MKRLILLVITCTIADVIPVIRPGSHWALSGNSYDGLAWLDAFGKPTEKEIGTAIADCIVRTDREKLELEQAKIDLNTQTKTDTQRIEAIIKYLQLDK